MKSFPIQMITVINRNGVLIYRLETDDPQYFAQQAAWVEITYATEQGFMVSYSSIQPLEYKS